MKNVAIIGNGNVSNGALRVLSMLGANVRVYRKEMENLFKKEKLLIARKG